MEKLRSLGEKSLKQSMRTDKLGSNMKPSDKSFDLHDSTTGHINENNRPSSIPVNHNLNIDSMQNQTLDQAASPDVNKKDGLNSMIGID